MFMHAELLPAHLLAAAKQVDTPSRAGQVSPRSDVFSLIEQGEIAVDGALAVRVVNQLPRFGLSTWYLAYCGR